MNTNPNAPIEDATVVQEQTPEQQTQALIIAETDKLIETTLGELKKSTITDQAIAHLKAECTALSIADINDLQGYNAVKAAASKVKKIRTSIEAKRKELKAPAIRFGKALDAEADRITAELKPLEEDLNQKKKDYEDAVEAAKRAEFQRRSALLTEKGYQLVNGFYVCGPVQVHSDELAKITDVQLEVYVKHGEDELQRLEAERIRKQAEADALKAEREAIEAERQELARLKAEQARIQAELEAQKAALQQTYEVVVEPQQPVAPIEFGQPIHAPEIQNMEAMQQAYVAPEPEPIYVAPQPQPQHQPQHTEPSAPSGFRAPVPSDEFERGFNAFRLELDQLVKNPNIKLTRQYLHDWAWSTPFPKH